MNLVRRAAAAGCTLALALGGAVALAPAAHALPGTCFADVMYHIKIRDGQAIERACRIGEAGTEEAIRECVSEMTRHDVGAELAAEACSLASKPYRVPGQS
ncbi:hypothetical protein [Kitasatospora sp. NPDC089509]|uniref:hypothetical protein n=1 Tax=Kitasatospora sp. NPDC089509 TaxID=3364079 RepID=UPI0037FAE876